ncbi:exported protein of unknown function [uncultured Woeseiaceae bacterium]|uniref:Uncharacterized protein n=1 Tax=uncultured Woeseiaceae bacterium TaxID=1983305 RepID=A0A7D9H5D0_9GAMM|nr:exported protein of unknown function [uncultured Woeseiaceae bacterium]
MTNEAVFVVALIGLATTLMASNRVRYDVVALLVVLAHMISGVCCVLDSRVNAGREADC